CSGRRSAGCSRLRRNLQELREGTSSGSCRLRSSFSLPKLRVHCAVRSRQGSVPGMAHGRVELLRHDSRLLAGNPLGDPAAREVAVYLPPSYDGTRRFPTVTFLAGFTGSGPQLLNRAPFVPSLPERWDAAILSGRAAEAIVVMPDCFTRYGGSQY